MRRKRIKAVLGVLVAALFLSGCTNLFPLPLVALLSAVPTSGQAPLTVQFDLSGSTGPIESYTLSFGDGSAPATGTDLETAVVNTYAEPGTYTATLTVTGSQEQAESDQVTINVTAPPPSTPTTATLEAEPVSGIVSDTDGALAVTFHYSAEAAPGQRITRWELSFGDDSDPLGDLVSLLRIPETDVEHPYGVRLGEAESTYTATFKVWDEESGASPAATDSVVITVQSPPPVVTAFTATPQTGSAPLLDVDFEFTARAGAGKSLVKYTLEYGDGWSITEEGFSVAWPSTLQRRGFTRTYEEAGTYTARVTVWDDAGRKATKELEITVTG